MHSEIRLAMVLGCALILGACRIEELENNHSRKPVDEVPTAENHIPTIAGTPPSDILEGQAYEFVPTANDADGDVLEFSIARKPAWASFDRKTGRLSGTPAADDVGNFTNIAITVSDGTDSAALHDFNISVNQIAVGAATLSWMPPTQNADGSTLTDLAGYRIYYGRDSQRLTESVVLNNPGLTSYVVENLSSAKWFFMMTSVNSDGVESGHSAVISKTIG